MKFLGELFRQTHLNLISKNPEKLQKVEYIGNLALDLLLHYSVDPRNRLQPINVHNYFVASLDSLRKGYEAGRIRLQLFDAEFDREGLHINCLLDTGLSISQLYGKYRNEGQILLTRYIPDPSKYPFLLLISTPQNLLSFVNMDQKGKSMDQERYKDGLLVYKRIGNEERLVFIYQDEVITLNRLAPLNMQNGGRMDVWGAFVGGKNPPKGNVNERLSNLILNPTPSYPLNSWPRK